MQCMAIMTLVRGELGQADRALSGQLAAQADRALSRQLAAQAGPWLSTWTYKMHRHANSIVVSHFKRNAMNMI